MGAKSIRDTLRCMVRGGIVCHTGLLGGIYTLDGFDPIKEIPNGVYLTGFFSNTPTQEVMTDIFHYIEKNGIVPKMGACVPFSKIRSAVEMMDAGTVDGKIVVTMEVG